MDMLDFNEESISRRGFLKAAGGSVVALAALGTGLITPDPAFAASSTRKGYTIKTGNTTTYKNAKLSQKIGAIFDTDEVTVLDIQTKCIKVRYPVSGGTKVGYVPIDSMLTRRSGTTVKAKGKITTYIRPGGAIYGYIAKNDSVLILGTSGNYTQVKYPVKDGYKYAFVRNTDRDAYLKNGGSSKPGATVTAASVVAALKEKVGDKKLGKKYSNMCLSFVADFWKEMGFKRSSASCAREYGASHRDSSSMKNIPVGADVFFTGSGTTCHSCGKPAGHIGIYIGNGYMVHSMGGKIRKDKVKTINKYSNLDYYGWGWHGNVEGKIS